MANVKISNLTAATTPVAGTEVLPIVQSGSTVKVSIANLTPGLSTITTAKGGTGLTSFTSGGVVYASSTSALATGSALVFDGTNLGLGVTPTSYATVKAIQLNTASTLMAFTNEFNIGQNVYYNAGNKYITTGAATMYAQTTGQHQWFNAPAGTAGNTISFTQAMTLDASGNLGVGTTSPASFGAICTRRGISVAGVTGSVAGSFSDGANDTLSISFDSALSRLSFAALAFNIGTTERARIDSSGNLLVGTTSGVFGNERVSVNAGSARVFVGKTTSEGNEVYSAWSSATSGNNRFAGFWTETSATERGSITYNRAGGLVAYNTTSDYRAKDISGPVTGSGSLIDSVPVYMGTMKGATQERPMFIAHETPNYAHTGEKDAVDTDGNPVYQQMDASALVPVMWAEIQSLRKRLATLEGA